MKYPVSLTCRSNGLPVGDMNYLCVTRETKRGSGFFVNCRQIHSYIKPRSIRSRNEDRFRDPREDRNWKSMLSRDTLEITPFQCLIETRMRKKRIGKIRIRKIRKMIKILMIRVSYGNKNNSWSNNSWEYLTITRYDWGHLALNVKIVWVRRLTEINHRANIRRRGSNFLNLQRQRGIKSQNKKRSMSQNKKRSMSHNLSYSSDTPEHRAPFIDTNDSHALTDLGQGGMRVL